MIYHKRNSEHYEVSFLPLTKSDVKSMTSGWEKNFNWSKYFKIPNAEVYKMVVKGDDNTIQGAVALLKEENYVYMSLVESAPNNRGKDKDFEKVGPHLIAYCCQRSFELGHEGYVAFESKSKLISYYENTIKARRAGNGRKMIIDSSAANYLVDVYLKQR